MDLEKTVKIVEAKEAGKKAGDYLDSSDLQVSKVSSYSETQRDLMEQDRTKHGTEGDEARCKYCGKKGHGAAPVLSKKKESCPAYDKKCNACGIVGHFARSKACRKKLVKVEMIVSNKEMDTGTGIGKVKGGLGNNGQCEMATVQKVNLKKGADEALRLSMTSPVPHMMDVEGKLVMAMPKSHPKMKV